MSLQNCTEHGLLQRKTFQTADSCLYTAEYCQCLCQIQDQQSQTVQHGWTVVHIIRIVTAVAKH